MMRPTRRRIVLSLALAALGGVPSAAADPPAVIAPAVDLRRIRLSGDVAVAPAGNGSLAELTIDTELQRAADDLLRDAGAPAAALIAIDARTSEVLVFTERGQSGLLTAARAPAASVFKLVTTAALFETTPLTPADEICTLGGERAVERRHLEAPKTGDIRCAPFGQALGHSRNAAYAQVVTRLLLRKDLIEVAGRIGFNENVPFDGAVPLGRLSVPYNDLSFARTATGFENSTLSVLGGAYLASVVANGGLSPHLKLVRHAGDYTAAHESEFLGRVLSLGTARRLTKMMEVTVRGGTAHHAFSDEDGRPYLGQLRVAGKTGTLQPRPGAPTSSWFIGFAPVDSPRIVVSVLLQNGRVWRRKGAEVARDFLRFYFSRQHRPGITAPDIVATR